MSILESDWRLFCCQLHSPCGGKLLIAFGSLDVNFAPPPTSPWAPLYPAAPLLPFIPVILIIHTFARNCFIDDDLNSISLL